MSHDTELKHHDLETGMGQKTIATYMIGFVLSLILTIAAFVIADHHAWGSHDAMIAVSVLAIVQLWVQVVFFLRMNSTREGMQNTLSFLFAIMIVFVLIGGSLWIMHNLNYNMMH